MGDKLTGLVRNLADAEAALQKYLAGNVDAIVGANGLPLLLQDAQQHLLQSEEVKRQAAEIQSAILDALPANIALVNPQGEIMAVNESWRKFGAANSVQGSDFFVGRNYLEICERVEGECAVEAHATAQGIRRVLAGEIPEFSLEYACHSSTEQRWFRLMVSSLQPGRLAGAVVMHINVTERRLAEDAVRSSEHAQRRLVEQLNAEKARLVAAQSVAKVGSWETELMTMTVIWSDETHHIFGTDPLTFRPTHPIFLERVHPDDRAAVDAAFGRSQQDTARHTIEHRIVLPNGDIKIVEECWQVFCDALDRPVRSIGTCRDLTAQKEAQAEIDLMFNLSADLMSVTHFDGPLEQVNPAWTKCLGWSASELVGRLTTDFIHPEDRPATLRARDELIAGRPLRNLQNRYRCKDGSYCWLSWNADPLLKTRQVFAIARDITEQRQADAENRRNNETLAGIVHAVQEITITNTALPEMMMMMVARAQALTRATGGVIEFIEGENAVYRAVSGSAENLLGFRVPLQGSLSGQVASTGAALICDDADTDDRVNREACRKVGVRSMVIAPLHDGPEVIGVLKVISDQPRFFGPRDVGNLQILVESFGAVIQRRLANEKLREQAALLDKAQDAIVVHDLDHHITFWNRSAERIYGWTAAEAVGRSVGQLIYFDPGVFDAIMLQLLAQDEWSGEIVHTRKDGHRLDIGSRWTLVRDDQGRPKAVLAINTDLTERKKLEHQFLRVQRMESLGTLAGGIAHDLNNLLAPITMGVELLRTKEPSPRSLQIIDNMERSARRGADLVKQVLSFARGVEGTRVPLQVKHIIREVESIVENTFPKNITIECDLPTDLRLVLADATQINQVLLNLCVNARDAMPNGGILTLLARNVTLDPAQAKLHGPFAPGPYIMIEVTDTGSGISREIIDHIFEPFFTTKEVGKGTGLGLSTVLGIVKGHGGFVDIESESGRGSTFRVHLPVHQEAGAVEYTGDVEEARPSRGNGELVLLVDDEAPILQMTQTALESFGYRVLTAGDGAKAIGTYAMHQREIAAVLTDMMMPVMDGANLITALQRINPAVRIIAASGLNTTLERAKDAGVKHFLPKPYSAVALLTQLQDLLGEKAAGAPDSQAPLPAVPSQAPAPQTRPGN